MPRSLIASFAGVAFVLAYMVVVITLPDYTGRMHWLIEALYWVAAGVVWVFPVRWLMLWSVHKR